MADARILRFYLHDALRKRAMEGRHNFLNLIGEICENAGFRVEYCDSSLTERLKSATRKGYAVFLMDDPFHDRAVTVRKVYHYPFWAIEHSPKRWEWKVARTGFDPLAGDGAAAEKFYRFWQKRLFGDAVRDVSRQGLVYVPLQGRLLQHRSFQSCSPLAMLEQLLQQDRDRDVIATLHPKESYDQAERDALSDLARAHPRLRIESGRMEHWLQRCDYVVSQNSAAAFSGFFFGKPAVLFGRIDFHHIAANVHDLGVEEALRLGPQMEPDYTRYIHWFWQEMSINAGHPDARGKIHRALLNAGWQV